MVKAKVPTSAASFTETVTAKNADDFQFFMYADPTPRSFVAKGSVLVRAAANDRNFYKWVGGELASDMSCSEHIYCDYVDLKGSTIGMKKKAEKVVEKSEVFWILWCPGFSRPPTVRFESLEKAREVAESMATKNPNDEFFIMEARGVSKTLKPVATQMFS